VSTKSEISILRFISAPSLASFSVFLFSQYSRCSCELLSTSTPTKRFALSLVLLLIFLTLEVSFHESTKFDLFCHVARQCSACVLAFLAPRSGFQNVVVWLLPFVTPCFFRISISHVSSFFRLPHSHIKTCVIHPLALFVSHSKISLMV
jgi:hypothetical protein